MAGSGHGDERPPGQPQAADGIGWDTPHAFGIVADMNAEAIDLWNQGNQAADPHDRDRLLSRARETQDLMAAAVRMCRSLRRRPTCG